jgi:hypothetical protein
MLRYNILPPDRKRIISLYHRNRLVILLGGITLIMICLSGSVLLGSKLLLAKHFEDIIAQTTQLARQPRIATTVVQNINTELVISDQILNHRYPWSATIIHLLNAVPSGIQVNQLTMTNTPSPMATLTGNAENRDVLLQLRSVLQALPEVENVSLPFDQLIKKGQSDFSCTITLRQAVQAVATTTAQN